MAKQKNTPKDKQKSDGPQPSGAMPFGRKNYLLLLVCVGLLGLGFIVMASETAEFGFGDLGLVYGPILLFLGFIMGVFAILIKPDSSASDSSDS